MFEKVGHVLKTINQEKWINISNCVTFYRILLTPFIIVGFIYQKWELVFWMLFSAGVSDLIDGSVARLLNQVSVLGKFLDPIADKILIITSFTSLSFLQSPSFPIPVWFAALVLGREFVIIFGTYLVLRLKINFEVEPTWLGKLNTLFQILFILWLFICYFFGWAPAKTYYVLLMALAAFSVLAMLQYIKIGINCVKR